MFDQSATICHALQSTSRACPNKLAIVDDQGQLTWSEFQHQVDALATWLIRAGLERGEPVAYLLWNQRELLISYHAITRIASPLVSLNYRLTASELAHQLEASSAKILIYDESLHVAAHGAAALISRPITLVEVGAAASPLVTSFADALREQSAYSLLEARLPTDDDIAGIWFTSGTEGRPKGAVVRHRSAIAAAHIGVGVLGIHRDARCLAVAPLFHRGAAETVALAVTMMAATHYLQPRFYASAALDALREYRITTAFIVPTMARLMLQELGDESYELPDLDHWISASAPLPIPLEQEVRRRFGLKGNIINAYGITEMLLVAVAKTGPDDDYTGDVGHPLPNLQVRIYDAVRGLLPTGEIGEILARGPCAFSHYLGDPGATERVAITIDGALWYHTGDIGKLDANGRLTVLDRKKDMILSGGENIYSAEVEAAILAHPLVTEVAVVGREHDQWGEIVVAFVVVAPGVTLNLADIRSACDALASYKHPKELVLVDALPRNSFGKVQKPELKLRLRHPA